MGKPHSAGMTPLFWVLLWSLQPHLVLLSSPDACGVDESSSFGSTSPLLESLRCHNDYESRVDCEWKTHGNQTLEVWLHTKYGRYLCAADEHRHGHCTYNTRVLGIGTNHAVFFQKDETRSLCSDDKHTSLSLHQHLRALPPVNLSSHETRDGGRRLQWSGPYNSSSSLSRNLTYQLSYRTHRQDGWTTETLTNTSVVLAGQSLFPDCRYEAKVRVRASVGHWSAWSPAVTWQTGQDVGQLPSLQCVLHSEKEVECSWEVRREVADFITYRLAYHHNQTEAKTSCSTPTVAAGLAGTVLRYSCLLTVSDLREQLLRLEPTHSAKTFESSLHIRPKPPRNVRVRENGRNWIVEWVKPSIASFVNLGSQVCYYRKQDPDSFVCVPEGSTTLTILGTSLAPTEVYEVKVRLLVSDTYYRGSPSEWSQPVEWTSKEDSWSYVPFVYILIGVLVSTVVITLYCTIPACRRKVVLWEESVPSPEKSKIIAEIKSNANWRLMQSEKTSVCRVQQLDSLSTGSTDVLLWPSKDADKERPGQDEGCQDCNDPSSPPAEEVNASDNSGLSFNGPYIFSQPSELSLKLASLPSGDKNDGVPSPSPVNFTLHGGSYVLIPPNAVSTSTQDLVSRREDSASLPSSAEEGQPGPDEPTVEHRPPEYTSEHFTPWPQVGAVQPSGYCHLPTAFMNAAE